MKKQSKPENIKSKKDLTRWSQNFSQFKANADKITDLNEKELYYAKISTTYKQALNKGNLLQQIEDEVSLIHLTRQLSNTPKQAPETPDQNDNEDTTYLKIRAVVIMEMLNKLGLGKAHNDLTKICKFIAIIAGGGYRKIYNDFQKGIILTQHHSKQIEEINKLLSELNLSTSIKSNIRY